MPRKPRLRDASLEGVKDFMEELKAHTYQPGGALPPVVFGQKIYWVCGTTFAGKEVVWGPYYSAQEADSVLTKLQDGEIFDEFDTINVAKATQLYKAELAKRGRPVDSVLKRMFHKQKEG